MRKIKTFYDWNMTNNNLRLRNNFDYPSTVIFCVSRDGVKADRHYIATFRDGVVEYGYARADRAYDDAPGFFETLVNRYGLPFYIDLVSDTKVNW